MNLLAVSFFILATSSILAFGMGTLSYSAEADNGQIKINRTRVCGMGVDFNTGSGSITQRKVYQ